MEFSKDANNVGFSFSTSNNVPSPFRLSKVPVDIVALFVNIGYIGAGTGPVKVINFSDSKSFAVSPDINIVVTKSLDLPITKLHMVALILSCIHLMNLLVSGSN